MDQNNNQTMNNNPDNGAKTFTQEQLNAIIGERLAKEKAKSEAALAEREQQLAKRELKLTAKEKIREMGLPMELLDALDVSNEEALDKALDAVKKAISDKKPHAKVIENRLPQTNNNADDGKVYKLRKAMGLPD